MKNIPFVLLPRPQLMQPPTQIIIHHVYKPEFAVCVPFFYDRKLGPVCHQIGGRVRSSFLSGKESCYKQSLYVPHRYTSY